MTIDLRTKLRDLPAPEPSTGLHERIMASRAAGERVVLPVGHESRWRVTVPRIAAAAIILVALAAPFSWLIDHPGASSEGVNVFAGSPFWPTAAMGQEVSAQDTIGRARYPLLDKAAGRILRIGLWRYRATMTTDGLVTTEQGERTFSIAPATVHGAEALAIVTSGRGRYTPERFSDSLVVTRDSLRLLRRTRRYGKNPRGMDFPGEPPRYLSWREADINWVGSAYRALFQLTPLNDSWRGSVYVPWITYPDRVSALAIDLRVIGAERITVPAGSYDTWVVSVRFRDQEARVYVSKDRGLVVKIAMPMGDDAVWEQVLTSAS